MLQNRIIRNSIFISKRITISKQIYNNNYYKNNFIYSYKYFSSIQPPNIQPVLTDNNDKEHEYKKYNINNNIKNNKKIIYGPIRKWEADLEEQEKKLQSALEKGGEPINNVVGTFDKKTSYSEKIKTFTMKLPLMAIDGIKYIVKGIIIGIKDPKKAQEWLKNIKNKIIAEAKHYWIGTKLLYAEISTSTSLLRRLLKGHALSRREKRQLHRTVTDLLRLVPFSFFIIVPFMEFLLPVALKLFPNMLPSTFRDSYQQEENLKRQLRLRIALAEFLQDTVKEVVTATRDSEGITEEKRATAEEVIDTVERAQKGEPLSREQIIKIAKLFNDNLMLANISRPQLVAMCRYMGLQPFGNDTILRFQLRNKIRQLKKDDQVIHWEGLHTLTKEELQQACMERGMKSVGLTKAGYLKQMKQWLDLSNNNNIPATLLILSRALNITAMDKPEEALVTSLSSMDEEIVTEVALEAGVSLNTKESAELKARKLESIRYQNEMIADEARIREQEHSDALNALESHNVPLLDKKTDVNGGTISDKNDKVNGGLTLAEASALESLAFKSLIQKERKAVQQMKQLKSEMDVEALLAAGRIGVETTASKPANRMMMVIDSMINKLELELAEAEKRIGNRLNVLDKDSDGVLSTAEIKSAIKTLLKRRTTEEDADKIVSQIDENCDGQVTLEELVSWIKKRSEMWEVTGAKLLHPAHPVAHIKNDMSTDIHLRNLQNSQQHMNDQKI